MLLPNLSNQKAKLGFYFHIPFCPHICPYCDFTKTSKFTSKDIKSYFNALLKSLDDLLIKYSDNAYLADQTHCTVYFGGGTPSLFPANLYAPLIQRLSQQFICEEISIETNPFTNKKNFISEYKKIGINRVTLGAQSLCHNTLKLLGRKHTKEDTLNNIRWLKDNAINEIQVDLIYGLDLNRTLSISEEVNELISAGATGISAYGLTLESRTIFGKSDKKLINESNAIYEYNQLINVCSKLKLQQIESSNFSSFPAKHNNIYWYGYPYFGIGTGAHGLLPPSALHPCGIRYKVGLPTKEIAPGNDKLHFRDKKDCENNFKLIYEPGRSKVEMIEELIFTLLRTKEGIPLDWLKSVFNNENLVDEIILEDKKIICALKEGKMNLSSTHIYLESEEKIRGDFWALALISCLL